MASGESTFSRAERVRARRLDRREGKPLLSRIGAAWSAARPVASAPSMVARNVQVERRLQQQERRHERRRRYLKLAEAGAELRLPALPSVQVGWRLISTALVAACAFALYSMHSSPAFSVARVELLGAERVNSNAINSALAVAGRSIFSIQPELLYEILRDQFPELERVTISVGLPGRVIVSVKEREPVIAWEQAGLTLWVDAAGVAFVPQEAGPLLIRVEAREAPPAAGSVQTRHQLLRPEMVVVIQALDRIAPDDAPLIYDPKLGFGWADPSGWEAYFGQDGQNIDQRLAVYLSILDELRARRLVPTLISVAQLHAPYYRLDY